MEWFSRALTFRSLYYPWGKMGTTRSLSKAVRWKKLKSVSLFTLLNSSCGDEESNLSKIFAITNLLRVAWPWKPRTTPLNNTIKTTRQKKLFIGKMKKINRNPYSDLKHYISFLFAGLCTNSISCPITSKPSPLPTSVNNRRFEGCGSHKGSFFFDMCSRLSWSESWN